MEPKPYLWEDLQWDMIRQEDRDIVNNEDTLKNPIVIKIDGKFYNADLTFQDDKVNEGKPFWYLEPTNEIPAP